MLECIGLGKSYPRGGWVVRDVSLRVRRGEAVGLVGPSGSGKSTVARMLARLIPPSSGTILLDGTDLGSLSRAREPHFRRKVQMIFQEPHLALDPKRRIGWSMREVLSAHGLAGSRKSADARIAALFAETGLSPEIVGRLPHEISGGQAQRVVLARALSLSPDFLIADEPTSMLDLSVQAMIMGLLKLLRARRNLGLLLISHDPAVVRACCDRVLFIRDGSLSSETACTSSLFTLNAKPERDRSCDRKRSVR